VDLADEVNETFAGFWNALFWPFGELELANSARLTILQHIESIGMSDGQVYILSRFNNRVHDDRNSIVRGQNGL
jgi:hypothetical protein